MNVFPALQGISWPVTRRAIFNTLKQKSVSGRVVTATYQSKPVYEFDVSFDYLSASDLGQLEGFFLGQQGGLTPFYFDAGPGYDSVSGQAIGAGDGSTTVFDLLRSRGAYTEKVDATFGTRTAYAAGSAETATFDSPNPGQVTFSSAPASGAALTWTGSYYFKCYFKADSTDFDEFMRAFYQTKTITLVRYVP